MIAFIKGTVDSLSEGKMILAVHAFGDFDFLYCLQCFRSGVAKRSQRLYRILEGMDSEAVLKAALKHMF